MLEDLDSDIRDHIERETEDNIARGMSPEEARRAALRKFGNVTRISEDTREVWGLVWLEQLRQDVRFGLRMLRKAPGFTAVAVLTLALGIGANTAIFSVINAVLLQPLPYPNPNSLVLVAETVRETERTPVSYPDFLDWQRENGVFQTLAAYAESDVNIKGGRNSDHVPCEVVSDDYFELLGVRALFGRTFMPAWDRTLGKESSVLLSYGLWQRRFGGDTTVIGRSIQLNETAFTILGVLPRGFRGFSGQAAIWAPIQLRDVLWPDNARFKLLADRGAHWHRVIGRMKPGVTVDQAQTEMSAVSAHLAEAYPETNHGRGIAIIPAKQALLGSMRTRLLVLFGAAGCVLLIACANLASLFLVRAVSRRREIAIRISLGAGRTRLVRQFLTESVVVATIGGSSGALLAFWLIKALAVDLPYYAEVKINLAVCLFVVLATGTTGVLVGSVPAWKALRPDPAGSLRETARCSTGKRQTWMSEALVVLQTAGALLLMIGAGLLLRSFERISQLTVGFRPDHLLTLRVHVPNRGYISEQKRLLAQRLVRQFNSVPGVDSAAADTADLFLWDGVSRPFTIEGRSPVPKAETDTVYYHEVSPGFFKTMKIPLQEGRDFTVSDDMHAPRAVIVSRSFAQRYWPQQSPIGKRLKFGPFDSFQPWMNVIGVVGDYRYHDYLASPDDTPVFYGMLAQDPSIGEFSLLVRTKTDPRGMPELLRRAVENFDPNLPVYSVATIEARIAAQSEGARILAELVTLFASLALVLSTLGLYGVLSYTVGRQVREIGIRMALGAQPKDVLAMVLAKGMRLTILGVAGGLFAALLLTRLAKALLFRVTSTDPLTFAAVAIVFVVVALAACYTPARRALRVDPMGALRYE